MGFCRHDIQEEPLGYKLKKVNKLFEQQINDVMKKSDMTFSQIAVLHYLLISEDHEVTLKELGEALQITHPTCIGLVRRLQEKELVNSVVNPGNKRFRNVVATDQARELVTCGHEWIHRLEEQMVKGFTREKTARFTKDLDRIYDNLKQLEQEQTEAEEREETEEC